MTTKALDEVKIGGLGASRRRGADDRRYPGQGRHLDYRALPALAHIVNPQQAQAADAPIIRDDKDGQAGNVIYDWEVGDKAATDRAFAQADVVSTLELHYPRSHPSPIECCGSVADFNRATSKLTVSLTTPPPHLIPPPS